MTNYANRGALLEEEVELTNSQYERENIALVQKIATPVKIIKTKGAMIEGFVEKKSTLDFRGTIKGGISISFDCKETKDEKGLPLTNIQAHQIEYMRKALVVDEITFLICYLSEYDKRYFVPGETVLNYWNEWQRNKGKRGYNTILIKDMVEIKSSNGYILDYLSVLEKRMRIVETICTDGEVIKENIRYEMDNEDLLNMQEKINESAFELSKRNNY